MKSIEQAYQKRPELFFGIVFLSFILVYLLNLGMLPLFGDEATRTVVALEMIHSGNYIVPTIGDVLYFNKPPFYNWLLIAFYTLFGNYSEFTSRLPMVLSLFFLVYVMYRSAQKHIGTEAAFLAAAMFLSCGVMLFHDSLLGHIDLFYSLVTYLSFILLNQAVRKNNKTLFYTIPFFLNAVAFLCKGLPSVIFIIASAGILLIVNRKLKWLFSWKVLLGAIAFFGPIVAYYFAYSSYYSTEPLLKELWSQSAERTVIDKAWHESVINLFTFWTDQLMHLAPWSLFFPALLYKGFWNEVKKNPFLQNMGAIFAINIIPYWLSPGYAPRYLFMLYPIIFLYVAHFYSVWYQDSRWGKIVHRTFGANIALLALVPFAVFFTDFRVGHTLLKIILLVLLFSGLAAAFFRARKTRMIFMLLALAVVRLGFDWFIIPHRAYEEFIGERKTDLVHAVNQSIGKPLYVHPCTDLDHYVYHYTEVIRGETLPYSNDFVPGATYLIRDQDINLYLEPEQYAVLSSFHIRQEHALIHLVEIGKSVFEKANEK